jgi:hypothetical protein
MAIGGGDYDGDMPAFFDQRTVRARKRHICNECMQPIEAGTSYRRVVGKWEGEIDTFRFCGPCVEIADEFTTGARLFGGLWDDIELNWDEGAHLQACLNRLTTVAAKEHMRQQWLKWKELK